MKKILIVAACLFLSVGCGSDTLPSPGDLLSSSDSSSDSSGSDDIVENTPAQNGLLVVNNVAVSGSTWSASDWSIAGGTGRQLLALPFTNTDQIKVYFNMKPDNIPMNAFHIEGASTGRAEIKNVAINGDNNVVSILFEEPLENDRYQLSIDASKVLSNGSELDGDWANPQDFESRSSQNYPSGDSYEGGDFIFNFNILHGNTFAGDNVNNYTVQQSDVVELTKFLLKPRGEYLRILDVNSNDRVDVLDVQKVVSFARSRDSI